MIQRALLGLAVAALTVAGCGTNGGARSGLQVSARGWSTDFAKHSVPLDEFVGGGPGKDGIRSIDHPRFISVTAANPLLSPREPVAVVALAGQAKAYPIEILVWHEIVNDRIGGRPIALTYCPLCNSTVAFDRRVSGRTLSFGTTGNLRNSDLVMYDRQTESWWQQLTAEAVVGQLSGTKLRALPTQILSWGQFRRLHPNGQVLSPRVGQTLPYGENPYPGYDTPDSAPFAFQGAPDPRLPPKERVVAVPAGARAAVAYPFSRLEREKVINDSLPRQAVVGGAAVVVFFDPMVASPLEAPEVSQGRDVGAAAVFERTLRGRTLTFAPGPKPGTFRDSQTGSTWVMSGRAIAGPLKGATLRQIESDDQFWFALAAFFPKVDIRR